MISNPPVESHARSLAKGTTWRCVATGTTFSIAWIVTGHVDLALAIGGIEFVAKIAVYYLHERCWAHIKFGMHLPSEATSR